MTNDHLIFRLATGEEEAVAWVIACARVVVDQRGAISLEAACKLSRSKAGRLRALRNEYIGQAARALGNGQPAHQTELHRAFERFRRETWPDWRQRRYAPENCTAVERCLFNAMKTGDVPRTPQMLGRIVRTLAGN